MSADVPDGAHALAIGVRAGTPGARARYTAPCATCGHRIAFRDATPMTIAHKLCVECFQALVDATPDTAVTVALSRENRALLRLLARRPAPDA